MAENRIIKKILFGVLAVILSIAGLALLLFITSLFFHGNYNKAIVIWGCGFRLLIAFGLQHCVCKVIPKEFVFSPSVICEIKRRRLLYVLCILPICTALIGLFFAITVLPPIEPFSLTALGFLFFIWFGWFGMFIIIGIELVFSRDEISNIALSFVANGKAYAKRGKSDKSIERFQRAINIFHSFFGDDVKALSDVYLNISEEYLKQLNSKTAREYAEKAIATLDKDGDLYMSLVAKCYSIIGNSYNMEGDYDNALANHQKALDIRLQAPDEGDIADSYDTIAKLSWAEGDYAKALDYYERTLVIRKRLLKDDDPSLAESYSNAGYLNWILADYIRAKVLLEKALNLRIVHLPKNHPGIAESYDNLGMVYLVQDELDDARQYFDKAYSMRKNFVGEHAHDISISYVNIGVVYGKQSNYRKSLEFYLKALDILENSEFGAEQWLTMCYNNIAESYCWLGDNNKASLYLNKAQTLQKEHPVRIYPIASELSVTAGNIFFATDDYNQALDCFNGALSERTQQLGIGHPYTALTLYHIGKVYKKLNENSLARDYLLKAKAIQEKCLDAHHSDLINTLNELDGLS